MDNLNVLFVSIAFPPKSDPECLQTAKYFKYLAKDKSLNIDVVTAHDKALFMPIDKDLEEYAKGYRQIIKVPFFENKYLNYILRKIDNEILQYPDSKFLFYKKYKWVLKQLKYKPDIIYSRSSPISSAIMAYYLQKELKVPWIMHLSDPWTLDPDHIYNKSKKWNEIMEKNCFMSATKISFTSHKTIELYKRKYPLLQDKFIFSPNVFDNDDVEKDNNFIFKNKIKIVFTGGLVGNRTAEPFLKSLLIIKNKYPYILEDFEIVFAGGLDRVNKNIFEKYQNLVTHIGKISYKQALKLQKEADILLLIDTEFKNEDDALFFPSKLLDYMIAKRRILAITDKDGTSWKFIEGKYGDCFIHSDTIGISNKLIEIWHKWKNKEDNYFTHNAIDYKYSSEYNAQKLIEIFKHIQQ